MFKRWPDSITSNGIAHCAQPFSQASWRWSRCRARCASGVGTGPGANPTLLGGPVDGSPIRHVIVIVQENRTFDNLFASSILAHGGPYPGANTSQAATVDGKPMRLKPVPFEDPADPSHSTRAARVSGTTARWMALPPITCERRARLATTAAGLSVRVRSGRRDDDLPRARRALRARRREFCAAPRSDVSEPLHAGDRAEPHCRQSERREIWGCDAKPGTTVPIFGDGEDDGHAGRLPVFRSADDRRSARRGARQLEVLHRRATTISSIRRSTSTTRFARSVTGPIGSATSSRLRERFLSDIQNCRLPQVSFVMPNALDSDHAGSLSAAAPAGSARSIWRSCRASTRDGAVQLL